MEQILGPVLVAALFYMMRYKTVYVNENTEADFEAKKRAYKEEFEENVEIVEAVEDNGQGERIETLQAYFALPNHLYDKIEDVKIRDKWVKVVDLSYITIIDKNKQK